jgi:hypothetical protein
MPLFINAVEEIVAKQSAEIIAQMDERISSRLRAPEVIAYALNRLPTLYATSWNGYNISRQRGINELSKDIILTVRNAALKILQSPPAPSTTPFTTDFEAEAQETLQNLRRIMDRDDIDLSNVVQVVQEFLSS